MDFSHGNANDLTWHQRIIENTTADLAPVENGDHFFLGLPVFPLKSHGSRNAICALNLVAIHGPSLKGYPKCAILMMKMMIILGMFGDFGMILSNHRFNQMICTGH